MGDIVNQQRLAAIRRRIDRVDRELVRVMAQRKRLVEAAAMIKRDPRNVVDEDRNLAVLDNVRDAALEYGLPTAFAERVWRFMTQLWIRHQIDLLVRSSGEKPYRGGSAGVDEWPDPAAGHGRGQAPQKTGT